MSEFSCSVESEVNGKDLETYRNLRQNGKQIDVIIQCRDGKIGVHRIVLSNRFKNNEDLTEFRNFSVKAAENVIDYLYGVNFEKLHLSNDDIFKEVFSLAQKTQMESLLGECWNHVFKKMRVENFVDSWQLFRKFQTEESKQKMATFIIDNFWDIIEIDELLLFSNDSMQDFVKMVGEYFSGDDAADFILRWINYDPNERRDKIVALLKHIDTSKLSSCYLKKLLEADVLEESQQQINDQITKNVSTEKKNRMEVTFACLLGNSSRTLSIRQVYNTHDKKWHAKKSIQLPQFSNWLPVLTEQNEPMYFSINAKNHLEAYDPDNRITTKGPSVSAKKLTATTDGQCFYLWDGAGTLAKYDRKLNKWMESIEIPVDFDFGDVFCVSSRIFALSKDFGIYEYNEKENEWQLQNKERENITPLKSLTANYEPLKLYFINKNSDISVYYPDQDCWEEKIIPNLEKRRPFYYVDEEDANCVLCSGRFRHESAYYEDNIWIYHFKSNQWEKLPIGVCKKILTRIRLSVESSLVEKISIST